MEMIYLIIILKDFPEYDYYIQLFATAPCLQDDSIRDCFNTLTSSEKYDSCFTALKRNRSYWFNYLPINYRPEILQRSQDITSLAEETTGLYEISKDSLKKYRCRIGSRPYISYVFFKQLILIWRKISKLQKSLEVCIRDIIDRINFLKKIFDFPIKIFRFLY